MLTRIELQWGNSDISNTIVAQISLYYWLLLSTHNILIHSNGSNVLNWSTACRVDCKEFELTDISLATKVKLVMALVTDGSLGRWKRKTGEE